MTSAERREAVLSRWSDGMSAGVIAEELQAKRRAIKDWLHDNGLRRGTASSTTCLKRPIAWWTAAKKGMLASLWNADVPSRDIASALGNGTTARDVRAAAHRFRAELGLRRRKGGPRGDIALGK